MYETYGTLKRGRSNAVLVWPRAERSHHVAGYYADPGGKGAKNVGWWDNMIGPGKPLTPGNSSHRREQPGRVLRHHRTRVAQSETGKPYGSSFPVVTVEDWVAAQARLADRLGIASFAAVMGGSLGAMQAMQWAISYPERIRNPSCRRRAQALRAEHRFQKVARQRSRPTRTSTAATSTSTAWCPGGGCAWRA